MFFRMKISASLRDWIVAVAATVIGLLLSTLVIRGVLSFMAYLNADRGDFEYTDIYERVAERRSVAVLSDEVVIVSVDGCSRSEIADVIDAVSFMSPSAVGLDLFFTYPSEDGSDVASALSSCDNVVLPVAVGISDSYSFFDGDFEAEYAAVNMLTSSKQEVVREYSTLFRSDTAACPSMAYALVSKAGYDVSKPNSRAKKIWYPSVEFDVIGADEIVGADGFPYLEASDRIEGKIVLLGVVNDLSDVFRTPVDDQMPGVLIHAHIIDTIINGRDVKAVSGFWNLFIAFVVCVLFLRLAISMKEWLDDIGDMMMSLAQLLLIYLFLVLGANLYVRHMFYVDFSVTVVILGLSMPVMNVVKGFMYLYSKRFGK